MATHSSVLAWRIPGTGAAVYGAAQSRALLKRFSSSSINDLGVPWWLSSKKSTCNAGATGDKGSIPGSQISLGGENGNPFQYSCQENSMGGAWGATVLGIEKSRT